MNPPKIAFFVGSADIGDKSLNRTAFRPSFFEVRLLEFGDRRCFLFLVVSDRRALVKVSNTLY